MKDSSEKGWRVRGLWPGSSRAGVSEGQGPSLTLLQPMEPLLHQELLVNPRPCSRALRRWSQGRGAWPLGWHSSQGSKVLPFLGWEEPRVGASTGNER